MPSLLRFLPVKIGFLFGSMAFYANARCIWAQWYITPAKQGKPIPLRRKLGNNFFISYTCDVHSPISDVHLGSKICDAINWDFL